MMSLVMPASSKRKWRDGASKGALMIGFSIDTGIDGVDGMGAQASGPEGTVVERHILAPRVARCQEKADHASSRRDRQSNGARQPTQSCQRPSNSTAGLIPARSEAHAAQYTRWLASGPVSKNTWTRVSEVGSPNGSGSTVRKS